MSLRWSNTQRIFGDQAFRKISDSKVLVIGAGGIGCELLKNLVLCGFRNIEIVDLDTIDISNLNRQFLFRRAHVGHPKSVIARESALKYSHPDDNVNIQAFHDDVKTLRYGPQHIKEFDIVLNALDNLSARRHVSRICLAANVPHVESGTAGWLGQVQPFVPQLTGCFECDPKEPPKTFPVCTIRSTPSKPIHTIVWAKHLFGRLFGQETEENAVTDMNNSNNNSSSSNGESSSSSKEAEFNSEEKLQMEQDELQLQSIQATQSYAHYVFHKVFFSDILALRRMRGLWTERPPPSPMTLDQILQDPKYDIAAEQDIPSSSSSSMSRSNTTSNPSLEDQSLWSIRKCAQIFIESCNKLHESISPSSKPSSNDNNDMNSSLCWDKDELLHLDFVVAAANIRSYQFGIPIQSKFSIKSDAGNIIPAIATTNAIIAGLIVLEAIKILNSNFEQIRETFLVRSAPGRGVLISSKPANKNPQCYSCSSQYLPIRVDTNVVTVKQLVQEILEQNLGMPEPTIMVGNDIIFESDGDSDHQVNKTLSSVKIVHSAVVVAESYLTDFRLHISIEHKASNYFPEPSKPWEVVGNADQSNQSDSKALKTKNMETSAPSKPKEIQQKVKTQTNHLNAMEIDLEEEDENNIDLDGDNTIIINDSSDDDLEIVEENEEEDEKAAWLKGGAKKRARPSTPPTASSENGSLEISNNSAKKKHKK